MLVEQAVNIILGANVGVGTIAGPRIYGGVLSQEVTEPAVVCRVVGKEHFEDLDGSSGLLTARFRVYSTARKRAGDYTVAKQLDEAVRIAMQGFSGIVTDTTVSPEETIWVQGISAQSSFDLYDDKTETHQIVSDYMVTAHEVIP